MPPCPPSSSPDPVSTEHTALQTPLPTPERVQKVFVRRTPEKLRRGGRWRSPILRFFSDDVASKNAALLMFIGGAITVSLLLVAQGAGVIALGPLSIAGTCFTFISIGYPRRVPSIQGTFGRDQVKVQVGEPADEPKSGS